MSKVPSLKRIEVSPRTEAPDSAVVWMHGLGDSGRSFVPLVPHFGLPCTRFLFLDAPSMPVTINGGFVMPAWYDILTLDRTGVRERESDIVTSAAAIAAVVDEEVKRGIPSERIVVAGFSQGGAMALHVGTRHPLKLAGIVVLSAYLLFSDRLEAERSSANRGTPVFFGHGEHDPMVPHFLGRAGFDELEASAPGTCEWHDYPIAHELALEEVNDLAKWLQARLA